GRIPTGSAVRPGADGAPGSRTALAALVEGNPAVDQDGMDARRILVRVGEGGAVRDSGRVEDDEIGDAPDADHAASREATAAGGLQGHLVDRLLEGDGAPLAHEAGEHAGERADPARVRRAAAGGPVDREGPAITADHAERMGIEAVEVFLAHREADHPDPATVATEQPHRELVRV